MRARDGRRGAASVRRRRGGLAHRRRGARAARRRRARHGLDRPRRRRRLARAWLRRVGRSRRACVDGPSRRRSTWCVATSRACRSPRAIASSDPERSERSATRVRRRPLRLFVGVGPPASLASIEAADRSPGRRARARRPMGAAREPGTSRWRSSGRRTRGACRGSRTARGGGAARGRPFDVVVHRARGLPVPTPSARVLWVGPRRRRGQARRLAAGGAGGARRRVPARSPALHAAPHRRAVRPAGSLCASARSPRASSRIARRRRDRRSSGAISAAGPRYEALATFRARRPATPTRGSLATEHLFE